MPGLSAGPEAGVELSTGPAPEAKATSGAGAGCPHELCLAAGGHGGVAAPVQCSCPSSRHRRTGGSHLIPAGSWPRNAGARHGTATRYLSNFQAGWWLGCRWSLGSPMGEGTPEQKEIVFVLKRTPQGLVTGPPHGPTCHRLGWGL